jgi:phosphate transport system substrate-binding protein
MKKLFACAAAAALMTVATSAHAARDYVWAAGSSESGERASLSSQSA